MERYRFYLVFAFLVFLAGCARPALPPTPPVSEPSRRPGGLPAGQLRGVWIADPRGVDWDRAARDLAQARINVVVVKFATGGAAYYPSHLLPFSGARRDEVQRCLAAMRRQGIAVHAWKVCFQMKDAPSDHIQRASNQNRVQRDSSGRVVYPSYRGVAILCPSLPQTRAQEARVAVELARLGVDGVQIDHIRWADGDTCFCSHCRTGFEQFVGRRVNWPRDAMAGGGLRQRFIAYRQSVITRTVYEIRHEMRATGTRISLSAAVFPDPQDARIVRGQDWKTWVDSGYLDWICPMNYTTNLSRYQSHLRAEMEAVGGKIPVALGLGIYMRGFTPQLMQQQIAEARRAGARGFVLFHYDEPLARTFFPALR